MYNQLALKTSQRITSDGYEVLPGERMSGYYAHIVEDMQMADVYESMSDVGSPENILCNRQVSCPNNYQRISLDNIKNLPRVTSAESHNNEALLKKSKSCGDLTDGRADITEYVNAMITLLYRSQNHSTALLVDKPAKRKNSPVFNGLCSGIQRTISISITLSTPQRRKNLQN
ncbi:hypothetical protein PoB_001567300 [Plakobranchus ocellatus]|uniref:Uncharacterized protein n=1 Tax=Plakobranchus ocellatus TaxID=259542 RepID=A0AAV3Z3W3_9GAST|nr:hypothetical protein PoB_001567300 [Plakobranchus ocellatus]